jgi:uncharacterized protein YndB with AHSA1/START domain
MKWVLIVLGTLAALVLLVLIAGLLRPRTHVATRTFRIERPVSDVWAVVSDFSRVPEWFSEVSKVERLTDIDGRPAWRETIGGFEATIVVREEVEPRRIVREILPTGPFWGTWTFELEAQGDATLFTVTENGTVGNPFLRGMMLFSDEHKTMTQYTNALARRLGVEASVVR